MTRRAYDNSFLDMMRLTRPCRRSAVEKSIELTPYRRQALLNQLVVNDAVVPAVLPFTNGRSGPRVSVRTLPGSSN